MTNRHRRIQQAKHVPPRTVVAQPCPTPHKVGYHRKAGALLAADKITRYHRAVIPYLCPCGRWHLTSQVEGR